MSAAPPVWGLGEPPRGSWVEDDRGVASRSRWAAPPRKGDSEILEVLVYEADGHGSFAHGRRHALDRAASNVACCEDAGPAGLEQKGSATERPSLVLGPVEDGAGPGEDEAVIVEPELASEPTD